MTIKWRGRTPKNTGPPGYPYPVATATNIAADPSTTQVGPTATIVPPTGAMLAGDLVVVHCYYRGTNTNWTVATTGGQEWNTAAKHTGTNNTVQVFYCRWNGSWAANPIFSIGSGTETMIAVMSVWRSPNRADRWALDQGPSLGSGAGTGFTITGVTPRSPQTVAIACVASLDDNTYTLTTGPWQKLGLNQYRSTGGTDAAIALAFKTQNQPVATGNLTLTQATLGADAGITLIVVFKAGVDFEVGAVSARQRSPFAKDPRKVGKKSPRNYEQSSSSILLVVQDATHAHAAGNFALTQANTLAVADARHTHAADNLALTQANTLSVADAMHSHAADNTALTQANALAVQDAQHGHTAETQALTQANTIAVQDAAHGHTADNASLTQANTLAVNESLHGHAADNTVLSVAVTLAVQDTLHSHAADNASLTQANVLAVADSAHSHRVDSVALTQANVLAVQDAIHSQTADSAALTQANTLAVNDALHGHSADNAALNQANTLSVADALHGHAVDNVALTQGNALVVADTVHGHTADNLALTQAGTLAVADATHGHAADNVSLTQANTLAVADTLHGQGAENVVLTGSALDVVDTIHAHTGESPTLIVGVVLIPADCLHGNAAETVTLRPVRLVEFLAAAGQSLTAALFVAGADTVIDSSLSVIASPNRQMMYRASFDDAVLSTLYQLIVYAAGVPIANWYVKLAANSPAANRSGNYADIVLAESVELMRAVAVNKMVTHPVTGVMTVYEDDDTTPLLTAQMHENAAQTQTYRGRGAEVRGRLS